MMFPFRAPSWWTAWQRPRRFPPEIFPVLNYAAMWEVSRQMREQELVAEFERLLADDIVKLGEPA